MDENIEFNREYVDESNTKIYNSIFSTPWIINGGVSGNQIGGITFHPDDLDQRRI